MGLFKSLLQHKFVVAEHSTLPVAAGFGRVFAGASTV